MSPIGTRRLLRPVLLSIALVATGLGIQAAPTTVDLPVDRPEAFQLLTPLAVTCATNPLFTGRLTASSSSTTAVSRITSSTVYGYISDVDRAWSCTASVRYSAIAWNTTASTGTFDLGNVINSTSVACNWVVGRPTTSRRTAHRTVPTATPSTRWPSPSARRASIPPMKLPRFRGRSGLPRVPWSRDIGNQATVSV